MKTLEELKLEADTLGVKYVKNIGAEKLAQKIEDYFESQAAGDLAEVKEEIVDELTGPKTGLEAAVAKETPKQKFTRESKSRQVKRLKTKIVTLTSNDIRENHVTTTAYLSCGTVSKVVPLNTPVELEEALIIIADTTFITLHRDEVVDGRRTGNKIPSQVKKYNVSYENMKAE